MFRNNLSYKLLVCWYLIDKFTFEALDTVDIEPQIYTNVYGTTDCVSKQMIQRGEFPASSESGVQPGKAIQCDEMLKCLKGFKHSGVN